MCIDVYRCFRSGGQDSRWSKPNFDIGNFYIDSEYTLYVGTSILKCKMNYKLRLGYRGSISKVTNIEVTKLRYRWSTLVYLISKFTSCTKYRILYTSRLLYQVLYAKTNGIHCGAAALFARTAMCLRCRVSAPCALNSCTLKRSSHSAHPLARFHMLISMIKTFCSIGPGHQQIRGTYFWSTARWYQQWCDPLTLGTAQDACDGSNPSLSQNMQSLPRLEEEPMVSKHTILIRQTYHCWDNRLPNLHQIPCSIQYSIKYRIWYCIRYWLN